MSYRAQLSVPLGALGLAGWLIVAAVRERAGGVMAP